MKGLTYSRSVELKAASISFLIFFNVARAGSIVSLVATSTSL